MKVGEMVYYDGKPAVVLKIAKNDEVAISYFLNGVRIANRVMVSKLTKEKPPEASGDAKLL